MNKTHLLIYVTGILIGLFNITFSQWQKQSFPSEENLRKVRFADSLNGWVIGENFVYKTADGGKSWVNQDSAIPFSNALHVINSNSAFIAGSVQIKRTIDVGNTWTIVDTNSNYYYRDIVFSNSNTGYIVGGSRITSNMGVIRKTIDEGGYWGTVATIELGENGFDFTGIACIGDSLIWVVAVNGKVYKSENAGLNWTLQNTVGFNSESYKNPIADITFTSADTGFVVGGLRGQSIISRTIDGGNSWEEIIPEGGQNNPVVSSLKEIQMLNSNVGWIVGQYYEAYPVYLTNDGGSTWNKQDMTPGDIQFNSLSIINENYGWIVGDDGIVYKTTNGGITGIDEKLDIPIQFSLSQNFPNPFNPTTTIEYQIPDQVRNEKISHIPSGVEGAFVQIMVYDVLGQEVARIVKKHQKPGYYETVFDASNLPSGIYYYSLIIDNSITSKKMVLLK
jgi:photosystem II stability/assembly factor-like uncharacterized protein